MRYRKERIKTFFLFIFLMLELLYMMYFLVFYLGCIVGSFLYCLCSRYIENEKFVFSRSKCDTCKHRLSLVDLIPIFSYIFNFGRCRYCKQKIGIKYLFSELISGAIFLLVYLRFGINFKYIILYSIMFCVSVIDYKTLIIPDLFVVIGIINRILYVKRINELPMCFINSLVIVLPILMLLIIMNKVLKKESMGLGDIKLFFMFGLYFSYYYNLIAVLISCFIGIIYILITKKNIIPYGPAICMAFLFNLLFF